MASRDELQCRPHGCKGNMTVRYWCIAVVLLTASGCSPVERAANRSKWESLGIVDYRMEVRGECYLCGVDREAGGPFVIEVVQGKVVKATYSDDGSPVPTSVELPTVEDLFARIREGLRGWRWSAKAKYDEHLGYPIYSRRLQRHHGRGLRLYGRRPASQHVVA